MKKLSQSQIKHYSSFLEDNKHLVGLQGWTVVVKPDFCNGDMLAECEPNIYEQILAVSLTEEFIKLSDDRQRSILIHELVHGRIEIFKKILEELTAYEEERLANDLERGFFSLYKQLKGETK